MTAAAILICAQNFTLGRTLGLILYEKSLS